MILTTKNIVNCFLTNAPSLNWDCHLLNIEIPKFNIFGFENKIGDILYKNEKNVEILLTSIYSVEHDFNVNNILKHMPSIVKTFNDKFNNKAKIKYDSKFRLYVSFICVYNNNLTSIYSIHDNLSLIIGKILEDNISDFVINLSNNVFIFDNLQKLFILAVRQKYMPEKYGHLLNSKFNNLNHKNYELSDFDFQSKDLFKKLLQWSAIPIENVYFRDNYSKKIPIKEFLSMDLQSFKPEQNT